MVHVLVFPVTTCLLWSSSVLCLLLRSLQIESRKKLICACSRWINHWKLLSFSCAFPRPWKLAWNNTAKLMKKWINRDTIVFGKPFPSISFKRLPTIKKCQVNSDLLALKMGPFRWGKYSPIFESNLAPLNQGQCSTITCSWFGPKGWSGPQGGLE